MSFPKDAPFYDLKDSTLGQSADLPEICHRLWGNPQEMLQPIWAKLAHILGNLPGIWVRAVFWEEQLAWFSEGIAPV